MSQAAVRFWLTPETFGTEQPAVSELKLNFQKKTNVTTIMTTVNQSCVQ